MITRLAQHAAHEDEVRQIRAALHGAEGYCAHQSHHKIIDLDTKETQPDKENL